MNTQALNTFSHTGDRSTDFIVDAVVNYAWIKASVGWTRASLYTQFDLAAQYLALLGASAGVDDDKYLYLAGRALEEAMAMQGEPPNWQRKQLAAEVVKEVA